MQQIVYSKLKILYPSRKVGGGGRRTITGAKTGTDNIRCKLSYEHLSRLVNAFLSAETRSIYAGGQSTALRSQIVGKKKTIVLEQKIHW